MHGGLHKSEQKHYAYTPHRPLGQLYFPGVYKRSASIDDIRYDVGSSTKVTYTRISSYFGFEGAYSPDITRGLALQQYPGNFTSQCFAIGAHSPNKMMYG